MAKHIILDHPKGQVFITVGSNDEKLIDHVIKKIEVLFGVKAVNNDMKDLFGGLFDHLGKK